MLGYGPQPFAGCALLAAARPAAAAEPAAALPVAGLGLLPVAEGPAVGP